MSVGPRLRALFDGRYCWYGTEDISDISWREVVSNGGVVKIRNNLKLSLKEVFSKFPLLTTSPGFCCF